MITDNYDELIRGAVRLVEKIDALFDEMRKSKNESHIVSIKKFKEEAVEIVDKLSKSTAEISSGIVNAYIEPNDYGKMKFNALSSLMELMTKMYCETSIRTMSLNALINAYDEKKL